MDQPPVILARDGIFVALAQKADLLGIFKLLDVGRIGAELLVIKLDRAPVLQPALHCLLLLVALDLLRYLWRGDGKRQQHQEDHHQDGQQQVAVLGLRSFRIRSMRM